eukprot:snap_masked-scaffold_18-processed-gene-0.17-mRNA-1 protein AED:0.27 eAED:0.27 QI:0/-1/0/1/-1/1/1/0/225
MKQENKSNSFGRKRKRTVKRKSNNNSQPYNPYRVFVGQLPYKLSKEELSEHFTQHSAEPRAIRMLTDKNTNKFRGIAFLEFSNDETASKALKLHHSLLKGRVINVERTVQGKGDRNGRKEVLSEMRKNQDLRERSEIGLMIKKKITEANVGEFDFDEKSRFALKSFPLDIATKIVEDFFAEDILKMDNKDAFLMGIVKSARARLKGESTEDKSSAVKIPKHKRFE